MTNEKRREYEQVLHLNERWIEQSKKDALDYLQSMIQGLEHIKESINEGKLVSPEEIRQLYGQQSVISSLE